MCVVDGAPGHDAIFGNGSLFIGGILVFSYAISLSATVVALVRWCIFFPIVEIWKYLERRKSKTGDEENVQLSEL
jgi:hypothetical protein